MANSREDKTEETADRLPTPPPLKRRVAAPMRLAAGIAVVTTLPALALTGLLGEAALERIPRISAVFAVLLLLFRVIGKRELGRLSPFELVTLMLVPEVVSNAVQNQGSLVEAFTGLAMLFFLVLATSVLAHRFETVEKALEPRSTLLVDHGRIIESAMNEERIVPEELYGEMRKQGVADISEVLWAVLESGGNITFIAKGTARNASADEPRPT